MGITVSLLLLAAGAILKYAVDLHVEGVNLQTVGVILMIVGALGAVFSLINWGSWGGFSRRSVIADGSVRRSVVDDVR